MFKFTSNLQKAFSMKEANFQKLIASVGSKDKSKYNFITICKKQTLNSSQQLSGQSKYSFSRLMNNNFISLNPQRNGLFFMSRNTFFTSILNNKGEKRIQVLEKKIEEQMELMSAVQLLENINELINLKTEFYKNNQYIGYVQDLQKKSNALYSLRKTNEALSILKQIEKQITETLSSGANLKKSKQVEQEIINLKIEYANTLLMRVQMQDAFYNEEEAQTTVNNCIKAIQILKEAGQAESDHMVVAQQTLGETYYKLGNIKDSASAMENAAYLLDQLISEISVQQDQKLTKEQQKENELSERHLTLRQAILYETLGNLHFDLRNMQQAEAFFAASLNLWENKISQNSNSQIESNSLDELVLKSNQQCIDNVQKNIHPLHMRCLNSIGTFYSTNGQTTKALQVLSNAKKYMHTPTVENADNYSWVLLNMAKTYYKQQQYRTSFQLTLESEEIARQFQISVINIAQILEHKSCLLTMQAKHKESAETIEEALNLFKENTQEPIYCRLLFSRGMQCIQTEQYEKAIQYAEKSKMIVENIRGPNDEQVGDALRIIGMAYCSMSLRNQNKNIEKDEVFIKGVQFLEKAIQLFSINNETRLQDQEAVLGDLANIYEYINNLRKAIMSYEQQRSIRIHILEKVGLPANTDEIIANIDEKIACLYTKVNQSQTN